MGITLTTDNFRT